MSLSVPAWRDRHHFTGSRQTNPPPRQKHSLCFHETGATGIPGLHLQIKLIPTLVSHPTFSALGPHLLDRTPHCRQKLPVSTLNRVLHRRVPRLWQLALLRGLHSIPRASFRTVALLYIWPHASQSPCIAPILHTFQGPTHMSTGVHTDLPLHHEALAPCGPFPATAGCCFSTALG